MTLKDQMRSDVTRVFLNTNEFGDDEIAYTPEGGSPKGITAIIQRREDVRYSNDGVATYQTKIADIYVSATDVTSPKVARHSLRGDKFTFDNLDWKIVAEPESDNDMRLLTIEATVLVDYDMGSRMK